MNTATRFWHRRGGLAARGVSLIEALVALAVVGFGMLAVVGTQTTLRLNGDVAKQRVEAVRIAQDVLDEWRGFTTLAADADRTDWGDLTSDADGYTVDGTNATFTVKRYANDPPAVANTRTPLRREIVVTVSWKDRQEVTNTVRLSSSIAGTDPDLRGLGVVAAAGLPARLPGGRALNIPPTARNLGDGRSAYVPPGQSGGTRVLWVFNNTTGLLMRCTTTAASTDLLDLDAVKADTTCTDVSTLSRYISGFLNYATNTSVSPTSADAANPLGPAVDLDVYMARFTRNARDAANIELVREPCFVRSVPNVAISRFYECAVKGSDASITWSGRLQFGDATAAIAPSDVDVATDRYRICRYFNANGALPGSPGVVAEFYDLPYSAYVNVRTHLMQQNYLVIRAGSGVGSPYTCPPSGGTPPTWMHQPQTAEVPPN